MKMILNAVNEAQAPVVEALGEEVLPADGRATTSKQAQKTPEKNEKCGKALCKEEKDPGKAALSQKASSQTPGENARFAQLRRCRQQMEQLLKQVEELTGESWAVVPQAQLSEGEQKQDMEQGCPVEDENWEERHLQELCYRRLAYLHVLEDDLRRIRQKFPKQNISTLGQLGQEYFALRESGIDPIVACAAVLQLREEEKTIPQMGLVSSQPQTAKEYYTPAEVDRLSEQELRDPGVMAAVRWSMTKWKQH